MNLFNEIDRVTKEIYKWREENNMDNKLDFDEVCDLASKLYWEVVNKFDAENKCVMSDPDNKGGTRNTEFGQELYYLIEDTIKESIDYKEEEDDDNDKKNYEFVNITEEETRL